MLVVELFQQTLLEAADIANFDTVEISAHAREDRHNLLFHGERTVLRLLQEFGEPRATGQQALRRGIKVRSELREGFHLPVLRQFELDRAGYLLQP